MVPIVTTEKKIFFQKIPILGICYGLQLIAKLYGGKVKSSNKRREFGRASIFKKNDSVVLLAKKDQLQTVESMFRLTSV